MRITDCKFDLPVDRTGSLVAYVKIVVSGEIGSFRIQGMRLVKTTMGKLHVQFPTKKVSFRCANCREQFPYDAQYCAQCGFRVRGGEFVVDAKGRPLQNVDQIYPVDNDTRERLTGLIASRFEAEFPGNLS